MTVNAQRLVLDRNPVIDLLRGWAIIGMTVWHSVMWFGHTRCDVATCPPELDILWHAVFYDGSLLSVPLFYLTAGMTLALNLDRHRWRHILGRVTQIVLLGYALTFFVMGPDQWLHAFVLQSIGFGLALMSACSQRPWGSLALYAFALAATFYNLGLTQVLVPSFAAHESVLPVLWDGLRALIIDGGFAILPWSGFIALGFALDRLPAHLTRSALFAGGAAMMLLGLLLGIDKYPMSPGYLLFFSGLATLLVIWLERSTGALSAWLRGTKTGRTWGRLSHRSLEIFVIHYLIGHGLWRAFPDWRMSFLPAVGLGLTFLLVSALLLACLDCRTVSRGAE